MSLLPKVLNLLHVFLVVFVVVTPLLKQSAWSILVIHFTTCLSLLVHWYFNDDTCFLTLLEAKIRGIPAKNSFMHTLVSPVYDIQDETIARLSHPITYLVAIISAYRLWTQRDLIKMEMQKAFT